MTQQTTLDHWRQINFAEHCRPTLNTARRWAKQGRIDPPAIKHGRRYYVRPDAVYTDKPQPAKRRLVDRIRAAETQKP